MQCILYLEEAAGEEGVLQAAELYVVKLGGEASILKETLILVQFDLDYEM